MTIFYGLLSVVGSILVSMLFMWIFNVPFHSISILFLLPIGALSLGFLGTLGYFLSKKSKSVIERKDFWMGGFMGLILFISINAGEYLSTYVSEDGLINYNFQGVHISEELDSVNQFDGFADYLQYTIGNSEMSFDVGEEDGEGIEMNETFSTIRLLIEGLGFIIGAFSMGFFIQSENSACNACRKSYVKEKVLLDFSKDDYVPVMNKVSETIEDNNVEGFLTLLMKERLKAEDVFTETMKASLIMGICKKCGNSYIASKIFVKDVQGQYLELQNKQTTFKASEAFIESAGRSMQVS